MTNIGGGTMAFLLVQGGKITLHAGIGQPAGGLPTNIEVKSGIALAGKTGLTDAFADVVIDAMHAPRPLLAYSISKSYARAYSKVCPTMDDQLFTLSGEVCVTVDKSNVTMIGDFIREHGIEGSKSGFALRNLKSQLASAERRGAADIAEGTPNWTYASKKVLGLSGKAKKGEEEHRYRQVASLIANTPDLPDITDPSWSIALRMLKRSDDNAKIILGEAA
ncbi:hypothetical protein KUV57_12385 [Epibacterium sp. DP7N7-1]|nr:hypothetical protein [Epibacterium sp. DP7N7-1]